MRTTFGLLAILFTALSAQAAPECQPEYLSQEDLAIMASVRAPEPAAPSAVAVSEAAPVLYGEGDPYGILTPEDLAIIRSVQPEGARIVLCPTRPATLN